jgi:hypothetical protein
MPGINETGLPNTDDYNLGRGIVYFASLSGDLPVEYRDLGNAPEFNISVETETLEHQSSRQGLKITDKEVLISQKVSLSLTLDEINFENLASLLSGTSHGGSTYVNPAVLGTNGDASEFQDWVSSVELGRWYDLHDSIAGLPRFYDVDPTKITLEVGATPLVKDTDYTVDEEMGRIFFLTTAVNVTDTDQIDFTYAADATAKTVDEVRALTQTAVTGALKFIAENPASNDKQTEFQFHKVSLKAEGDFALIGDEFSTMQFTAVAESNATADADSPTLTIRTVQDA